MDKDNTLLSTNNNFFDQLKSIVYICQYKWLTKVRKMLKIPAYTGILFLSMCFGSREESLMMYIVIGILICGILYWITDKAVQVKQLNKFFILVKAKYFSRSFIFQYVNDPYSKKQMDSSNAILRMKEGTRSKNGQKECRARHNEFLRSLRETLSQLQDMGGIYLTATHSEIIKGLIKRNVSVTIKCPIKDKNLIREYMVIYFGKDFSRCKTCEHSEMNMLCSKLYVKA